jgi:hypothetical protein
MEEKRPTDEQLAKYRKNAQDQSLSAEVRAKFQAVVDKFSTEVKELEGEKPKTTRVKKPATATAKKPATAKAKNTADDIEKAKAEIKAKTGKTEAECESIIEQYRALRTKAQEGKRKAEKANADNKERVAKLDKKGDIIEGTNEKTADAVIESTAKDVAEKIEKEIEVVEEKAEKEAKAEVAKDKTIKTPKAKKEAVEAKVEKKVAEKTKTIVKRVVIDTSALLTTISESLGKFDKDSQKEFLIKLRSDIDKLLAKFSAGGLTDGGVQVMNIQQSNLSASSVNPTLFAKGGGVFSKGRVVLADGKGVGGNKNKTYQLIKFDYTDGSGEQGFEIIEKPSNKVMSQGTNYSDILQYFNLYTGKFAKGGKMYKRGGVVGQEIVFDDGGEENTGVIQEVNEITGDYIVVTDDGRTVLAQHEIDVISLGEMRKKSSNPSRKKFLGIFKRGGSVGESAKLEYLDDAYASDELKEELREKINITGNSVGDNVVISFAYTDYGGDFLDKVAIAYFKENYPENIVWENAGYNGENAYVFGEPAQEWIDTTDNYPLGFDYIEDMYYEMQTEAETEDFASFLEDIHRDGYIFDGDEVMYWLSENRGGYYPITTQGIDFSYSDLKDDLIEEGLISIEEEEEYAKGGSVESKINKLYAKSNFINDDFNWQGKLLEMLQDMSIEAYEIYQSLNEEQKEEVLQELYEMDNDMGSDGDGDIETSRENLYILLQDAKNGNKYAKGGNVSESINLSGYRVTNRFSDFEEMKEWVDKERLLYPWFHFVVTDDEKSEARYKVWAKSKETIVDEKIVYAKGGLTAHGLKLGDKIIKDFGDEEVAVRSVDNKRHFVNLDKGMRGEAFAKGGSVKAGDFLTANTGVKVKVVAYDPLFGGRVKVIRMDEYGDGKTSQWMPLNRFKLSSKMKMGGNVSSMLRNRRGM